MFRKACILVLIQFLALTIVFQLPLSAQTRRASASSSKRDSDPVQYVNPFIGTAKSPLPDYLGGNSSGNTFPGATMPFGMIQWSPDTDKGFGKDERGSYLYADSAIRGFSLTHLSGPGCPVFGDVPIMPVIGEIQTSPHATPDPYLGKFSHSNESASPGFY